MGCPRQGPVWGTCCLSISPDEWMSADLVPLISSLRNLILSVYAGPRVIRPRTSPTPMCHSLLLFQAFLCTVVAICTAVTEWLLVPGSSWVDKIWLRANVNISSSKLQKINPKETISGFKMHMYMCIIHMLCYISVCIFMALYCFHGICLYKYK